ncbi:MAG: S8 family serine peptidase, partial [Verrucomicrobia bacterium]|nr:S8 family serine peptidase [Verrucomicrobiota bacterium]
MKKSSPLWMVLCLLLLAAGAWLIWHFGGRPAMHSPSARLVRTAPRPGLPCNPSAAPKFPKQALASQATNQLALRLSNTREPLAQLIHNSHAILLENAFIDTSKPLNLAIPAHLRAKGDAGAYIVQAQGPIGTAFRATLSQFGATIVSYIPNNAYLVELDATNAAELAEEPAVQAVIPYQPYYKIDSLLLPRAVANHPLPDGKLLTLGLYADSANRTISEIENMGGQIVDNGGFNSPFGPVVTVRPPRNWTALTGLRGVQIVEPFLPRILANDLSRAEDAVAANSVTASNYMNLSGSNVLVEVDDSGIDTNHPDFKGAGVLRVLFNNPANGQDIDGHGTHVAGIIAGDGSESETVTNASGSIITNTAAFAGLPRNARHANPFQFRGMAPAARLFAMNFNDSDYDLQEAAAKTNAPISNNSWNFSGDNLYDLAAASYDAATRDALPEATGSQPVLFVFSAGNFGNGNNSGGGGSADTILSPATAKNVVTVGAIEELRDITNIVTDANSNQSAIWQPETDTSTEVASFSSRGNVGIGTEGPFGRFKPDVVAPGTFVVSTRSSEWDITNYFYQNPTNYDVQTYSGLIVQSGSTYSTGFPAISDNTIGVAINLYANPDSPSPFPTNLLPIYVGLTTSPGYDFFKTDGAVNIPPDGGAGYLDQIKNTETFDGFYYAVSNATTEPVDFDLTTTVI